MDPSEKLQYFIFGFYRHSLPILGDTGEACIAPTVTSAYGIYNPKWAKIGETKTFPCQYDCKHSTEGCKLKAVFSCEKTANGKLDYKQTYQCVRTKATVDFENLNSEVI